MIEHKQRLIELYASKILGVRNYRSQKHEFDAGDFRDLSVLAKFLDEVHCGESDITPAGLAFLEQYYGYGELSESLVVAGHTLYLVRDRSRESQISAWRDWFCTLVPMEVSRFIEEARGTIGPGAGLGEELMPPTLS